MYLKGRICKASPETRDRIHTVRVKSVLSSRGQSVSFSQVCVCVCVCVCVMASYDAGSERKLTEVTS